MFQAIGCAQLTGQCSRLADSLVFRCWPIVDLICKTLRVEGVNQVVPRLARGLGAG